MDCIFSLTQDILFGKQKQISIFQWGPFNKCLQIFTNIVFFSKRQDKDKQVVTSLKQS